jgi:hypothetical protein
LFAFGYAQVHIAYGSEAKKAKQFAFYNASQVD